jgi:hypothetical protein
VFVLSEYCKLGFYGVRYGYLGYVVIAGAVFAGILWVHWRRRAGQRVAGKVGERAETGSERVGKTPA